MGVLGRILGWVEVNGRLVEHGVGDSMGETSF
jgi:hypothetical protein